MSDIAHALTIEELRARGEPSFFERDPVTLKGRLVAWYEEASKRTLYPDQTEMFLIEMLAYALSLQAEEGQAAALQNLVAWSEGRHLDDVAAGVQIFRQPAARALTRLRFTLPAPSANGTLVPAGTIAAAGAVEFRTTSGFLIEQGDSSGEVEAEAVVAGVAGNGFLPGQIRAVYGEDTAVNITASADGADIEGDERLAFRTIHAFDRVDRRGGWAGYGQMVLDVSSAITDVAIDRPAPGCIDIYALTGDDSAGPELRERIIAALSPEGVRPHGDDVRVRVATGVGFTVAVRVRSNRLPAILDPQDSVQARLVDDIRAEVGKAVRAAFKLFRRPALQPGRRTKFVPVRGLLGAQVSPSPLIRAAQSVEGIIDVEVSGIVFADLPFGEYPYLESLDVLIAGAPDA